MILEENRVLARENSTLVFATVAASASLLFLALVLQEPISSQKPEWVKYVGLMFSILGPLYREFTIFGIDRIDYRNNRRPYSFWVIFPRMVTIRFFLFLPIAAWLVLFFGSTCFWTIVLFWAIILFTFIVSILLSVMEWLSRYLSWPLNIRAKYQRTLEILREKRKREKKDANGMTGE